MLSYHKIGIWIRDVHQDNYLDGILFDLSRSRTAPHPDMSLTVVKQAFSMGIETPAADYEYFDNIIANWNHKNPGQFIWFRFLPNLDYVEKLRGFDRSNHEEFTKRLKKRVSIAYQRPELYKWQGN